MISIEVHTEGDNAYLIDVLQQQIKHYLIKGKLKEECKWRKYLSLEGKGKVGEPLTIVWSEKKKTTKTTPVMALKFVS